MTAVPEIPSTELAERLDRGEPVQVLDVRAPHKVNAGHVAFGAGLDFRAMPNSQIFSLSSIETLGLDQDRPVAVICGHGNSSKQTTTFLRERGYEAFSVAGGMAAWETVYIARAMSPTPSLEHVVQLDRIGKGALSYVLVSDGDAVVVDPGRHVARYDQVIADLGATPVAVVETHMHADYLSGAAAAAARWQVPYFVHPEDAVSPFDASPARFTYQPLRDGDTIAFGRATLRAAHVPGHTLGSIALLDDRHVFTGDFLFVQSVGRPDLGGQADAWAKLLWQSLERARREWEGDVFVLPAHYAADAERRADRAVAARFDVVTATNEAARIQDQRSFLQWVTSHAVTPPEAYRTIKQANLGLVTVSDSDAEVLESGPNQCAVR